MIQPDVLFFIDVLTQAGILWVKVASRRNGEKMLFFMLDILRQEVHSTGSTPKQMELIGQLVISFQKSY